MDVVRFMADYYSLLSRAVSNLPKSSPASARRAIYDRARKALIGQLRSLKPALPESDIAREENALDAAVSRLEAEFEPPAAAPAAPPPPIRAGCRAACDAYAASDQASRRAACDARAATDQAGRRAAAREAACASAASASAVATGIQSR